MQHLTLRIGSSGGAGGRGDISKGRYPPMNANTTREYIEKVAEIGSRDMVRNERRLAEKGGVSGSGGVSLSDVQVPAFVLGG